MVFDACIVGIGTSTEFGFNLGKSPLALQAEAIARSLDDAGLDKSAIDGFITAKGMPNGVDYEEFAIALGLDLRWATQLWSHGRWATNTLLEAAMVIDADLASYVAIATSSVTGKGYGKYLRELRGGRAERGAPGHRGRPWGMGYPRPRYPRRSDRTRGEGVHAALRSVPVGPRGDPMGTRDNASHNPMAIMRAKPMSYEDYLTEPLIVEPFRRPDYCLSSEGGPASSSRHASAPSTSHLRRCSSSPAKGCAPAAMTTSCLPDQGWGWE